jgi:hypothetical protein
MAVTKQTGPGPSNRQALDFFEESVYHRVKTASHGKLIVQRYLPSKSNKNSILRIIWQRVESQKI